MKRGRVEREGGWGEKMRRGMEGEGRGEGEAERDGVSVCVRE